MYWGFIIFCNLILPCIIFYPVRGLTSMDTRNAIGIGSAALGLSAMFEFPLRAWTLWRHRERCGPLGDECRWHFDSFMFFYTLAMLVAAFPLAIGPSVNPPLVSFFLMFPALLIGELGLNMLPTLFRFRTFTWLSSDPPGTRIKPAIFYHVEDICAVDCGKGRAFRREWNARYASSPPFRALMYALTVFWMCGCFLFLGIIAAIAFTTTLNFAFAFTLGLTFVWGGVWMLITWLWVRRALRHEYQWWAQNMTKEAS